MFFCCTKTLKIRFLTSQEGIEITLFISLIETLEVLFLLKYKRCFDFLKRGWRGPGSGSFFFCDVLFFDTWWEACYKTFTSCIIELYNIGKWLILFSVWSLLNSLHRESGKYGYRMVNTRLKNTARLKNLRWGLTFL